MRQILDRLKQRKVIHWAGAYLASSWLIFEVLQGLGDPWGIGDETLRWAQLLLIAGLPLVLVVAWFHGARGAQNVSGREVAVVSGVTLIMAGLVWTAAPRTTDGPAPTPADRVAASRPSRPNSLVVMPFRDLSPLGDHAYLASGISEEVTHLLAGVPELQVISQTSAAAVSNRSDLTVPEIASRLGVENVVEGSVRVAGERVRVTVQLVDRWDARLLSETYEGSLDDVFALQDSVAVAVARSLRGEVLTDLARLQRANPEAYQLFLLGRHINQQRGEDWYTRSTELLERVIALEPGYVPAWIELAIVHTDWAFLDPAQAHDARREAREATERALELDSTSAPAHGMLSAMLHPHDLEGVVREMDRALELAPRDPEMLMWAGLTLQWLGRDTEAIPFFEYKVRHDPLDYLSLVNLGLANYIAGRWDEAERVRRLAQAVQPGTQSAALGLIAIQKGDLDRARGIFEGFDAASPMRDMGLGVIAHREGRTDDARVHLQRLSAALGASNPPLVALGYALVRDREEVLRWVGRLDEETASLGGGLPLSTRPEFAWLDGDPEWIAFRERVGQSPERLAAVEFSPTLPE